MEQTGYNSLVFVGCILDTIRLCLYLFFFRRIGVSEARDVHIDETTGDLPVVAQMLVYIRPILDNRPPKTLVPEPHVLVLARLLVGHTKERLERGRRERRDRVSAVGVGGTVCRRVHEAKRPEFGEVEKHHARTDLVRVEPDVRVLVWMRGEGDGGVGPERVELAPQ